LELIRLKDFFQVLNIFLQILP